MEIELTPKYRSGMRDSVGGTWLPLPLGMPTCSAGFLDELAFFAPGMGFVLAELRETVIGRFR